MISHHQKRWLLLLCPHVDVLKNEKKIQRKLHPRVCLFFQQNVSKFISTPLLKCHCLSDVNVLQTIFSRGLNRNIFHLWLNKCESRFKFRGVFTVREQFCGSTIYMRIDSGIGQYTQCTKLRIIAHIKILDFPRIFHGVILLYYFTSHSNGMFLFFNLVFTLELNTVS